MKKFLLFIAVVALMSSCASKSGSRAELLVVLKGKSVDSGIPIPLKVAKLDNVYSKGDTVWVSTTSQRIVPYSWSFKSDVSGFSRFVIQ